jgi:phosphatidylethanolamine-binding protein (PEBP) family uncharacterized protein
MSATALARITFAATVAIALAGCTAAPGDSPSPAASASPHPPTFAGDPAAFAITSDDISADGVLSNSILGQSSVTCSGDGESLHIAWSEPPAGTESIAVLFENLTIPVVYWARIDIEPAQGEIEHGRYGSSSGRELTNHVGVRYPVAPCPSDEAAETYRITVWALDTTLGSGPRTYVDLQDGVVGHDLASAALEAEAIGTRQSQ